MSAFTNAQKFFTACETPLGWAGCEAYVEPGAAFTAQSEALVDVNTVEAYCEWMHGFGTVTAPGVERIVVTRVLVWGIAMFYSDFWCWRKL